MTKQEFLELYGKSVYQVYLEMASTLFCRRDPERISVEDVLEEATIFVNVLLEEEIEELKEDIHD
jgi:hypothetical protein